MNRIKAVIVSLALALPWFVFSCTRPEVDSSSPALEAAERKYLERAGAIWDSLFNSGNIPALVDTYAEDAISMPYGAPTVRGRAALTEEFNKFLAAFDARHETAIEEIIPAGDRAIERARYTMTYRPKAGGDEVKEVGRHVMCRKKIGGEWKIVWEIWNSES